jgi:hypothetical protein
MGHRGDLGPLGRGDLDVFDTAVLGPAGADLGLDPQRGVRATVAAVVVAADADGAMSIPAISAGAPTARNAPPSFLFIAIILSPPTSITLFRVHLNAV